MEGVPSPLQVGSPAQSRHTSSDSVPTALRTGSPAIDRGTPPLPSRPPLTRKNTSGSDRLSQLFPSRPPSVISSPDIPSSRRTSYPSPLIPASDTSYRIPRAPAPPSFSEDTSYNSTPDHFDQQSSQVSQASGTKRLLNRLTSLRSARARGGEYNRLDDEESGRVRLRGVQEVEEPVGYDLSGYDGLPMKSFGSTGQKKQTVADGFEQQRQLNEAGYAAEFERLEAQLGAGMSSIVEVPFTHKPGAPEQKIGHKRGISNSDFTANEAAQQEAEKSGGIVAVADVPIDISDTFGGGDFETRSALTINQNDDGSKTSYYFPEDPDMPAWRPFSMGWPWLSFLVIIALILAGVQEFLCQLSMKRSREDETNGLIRFKKPGDLTVLEYFTWKYAPVLFFVIYGILWQITDFEVKRLEPFYQLSKKSGATAAESLNMDYVTFMSWLVPLRALRHKQYAVIYISLATLIASSLVPVLQSASVNIYPKQKDRKAEDWKSIRIDPPWSRAVTACLVFVAICGSVLMYEMRRKSGLLSDPKGIAGVAAMATRSHILADFHGLDTAPLNKIHKQLRHRRYILHKSALWQGEYIRNSKERIHEHGSDPRPMMLRPIAGIPFIGYIVAFTASIPVFMFVDGANTVTEQLPFLLTALATIVKLLWGAMNCAIRMLEPFYVLSNRRAPAKTLTLDYTGTNPIFLPFKALMNRHYLVAAVGMGSILTEILTVCVSSFTVDGKKFIPGNGGEEDHDDDPHDRYNSGETFRSFWISFMLVILILIVLICIAALALKRRSQKFMPRQIGTIASVLAFIHQSKMLVNFVDAEKYDSTQMTKHLEKQGKTYALGWFSGRDGDDHCGIDEEPVLAPYSYGVDWTKTRVLGSHIGTWEHY
ncbi:hypothetical protein BU24DRAFT_346513 [Aaosphaeria arxii CBS 175.79]|uniref:Uncharacterized protein n=1 Tax=Aaosphaeria arxii CBS 175.79 TaxID=1450172 RepID=A0A6A5XTU4_9PLEO|nr:uncharacterized protein BU24DRAFT_346513 [Aaosphaeria arxii CBS 175.79]KAF2016237.1 hypothetical protein BU24DRAFT_346513 [Aaosphaeria arxii CBS 175.79]